MTKEEIKFYKEQQKKVEAGYLFKIETLQEKLEDQDNQIRNLIAENTSLMEQVAHLQSGLTGEEIDYLESR